MIFVIGAVLTWRNREAVFLWMHDEAGAFRRSLSRYTVIGPFYGLREESRFKAVPTQFLRSLSRLPRHRINLGAILLVLGALLFLLDFFI